MVSCLFQGNPKYYRILDAIRDFYTLEWRVTQRGAHQASGSEILRCAAA